MITTDAKKTYGDGDWQEENAAMMEARSSLQTPSKSRYKKTDTGKQV